MKTVKEMVAELLKKEGFEGLCNDGCGCGLDDLFECEGCSGDCKPAHAMCCPTCGVVSYEEIPRNSFCDNCDDADLEEK